MLKLTGNNEEHSVLSASSAHHWRSCVASAVLKDKVENKSNSASREGTALHAILETLITTKGSIDDINTLTVTKDDGAKITDDLDEEQKYVISEVYNSIKEQAKGGPVKAEERVYYGKALGVEDKYAFGTADAHFITECNGELTLHVADAKFGRHPVDAKHNLQLCLYAAGLLEQYNDMLPLDKVKLHILQPRSYKGSSSWETTPSGILDELECLKAPAKRIIDIIEGREQLTDDDFGTDPDDCKYCEVQGMRNPKLIKEAQELSTKMKQSTPEELFELCPEEALALAERMSFFVSTVRAQALEKVKAGEVINGYRLTASRDNRKWAVSEKEVKKQIGDFLPFVNPVKNVLKSPAEVEKEIKKSYSLKGLSKAEKENAKSAIEEHKKTLASLITRGTGEPKLVKADDVLSDFEDLESI